MTFLEMKTALYDRLGLTGETALVERLVNEGKDMYVTARKWGHLESSTTQLWTSGTRAYTAIGAVDHITALEGSTGQEVNGDIHMDTYKALYRPDTSTAKTPTVYVEEGATIGAAKNFNVWPSPSENSSGTMRFLVRVPDLATASDSSPFDHIPSNHHFVILGAAEILFAEYENDQQAVLLRSQWEQDITRLAGETPKEVLRDGT